MQQSNKINIKRSVIQQFADFMKKNCTSCGKFSDCYEELKDAFDN